MTSLDTLAPGTRAAYDGAIHTLGKWLMRGDGKMNDLMADDTIRNYVCAHCYGVLVLYADQEERWRVECPNCGDGAGFVTKAYASRRKSESVGEKVEVDLLLDKLGIVPKPKRSQAQNLKELGF